VTAARSQHRRSPLANHACTIVCPEVRSRYFGRRFRIALVITTSRDLSHPAARAGLELLPLVLLLASGVTLSSPGLQNSLGHFDTIFRVRPRRIRKSRISLFVAPFLQVGDISRYFLNLARSQRVSAMYPNPAVSIFSFVCRYGSGHAPRSAVRIRTPLQQPRSQSVLPFGPVAANWRMPRLSLVATSLDRLDHVAGSQPGFAAGDPGTSATNVECNRLLLR